MYDKSDPRAQLQAKSAATATMVKPDYYDSSLGLFYATAPTMSQDGADTWLMRGRNFVVAQSATEPGATLGRSGQIDEYAVLTVDPAARLTLTAGDQAMTVSGPVLAFMPPGDSAVTVEAGSALTRVFSAQSDDLTALCPNADIYARDHAQMPPFQPWPAPPGGFRIRTYSLDVPPTPGRFGKIFRCTTLMINVLDPMMGPRDITKMSPHHHDDFEQGSLALSGSFAHHLRWPWTTDMNEWRDDLQLDCDAPSLAVIPPPAIHTSRGTGPGNNQLIDIFSPPRMDFSQKDGWVLNAGDYPMPG